ncbi:hypothetical protein [Emcibacter sp.]|uniref:hypothetical protein n=1 Tax=Emcibacter sp. TaxID=1979954 RepID=UPI002AA710BA|nr:hypothetical protein [Emcibacter sp.]
MLSDELSNACIWLEGRHMAGDGLTQAETEILLANLLQILISADILECGTIPRSMREDINLKPFDNITRLSDYRAKEAKPCSTRA